MKVNDWWFVFELCPAGWVLSKRAAFPTRSEALEYAQQVDANGESWAAVVLKATIVSEQEVP